MSELLVDRAGDTAPLALWVVPVGDFGGVARHVLDAASCGIPGWRIVVLAPEGPLVEACKQAGIAVIAGAFGPEHGLRSSMQCLRHLSERLHPSVIHTHLAYADLTAAASFPLRRGPVLVSTEHGISGDRSLYQKRGLHSRVMAFAHRTRLRAFDGVIAVSGSTADQMQRRWFPPSRLQITVLPNGIDHVNAVTAPRMDGLRISTISRLSHEKRLGDTLEAFAALLRRESSAHLTIAGDGPDREELLNRCTQLGIEGAVSFPGFMKAQELLRRTDVLVQLSAWENCSYTILDAINAGVGVVATPVGGNPEILPPRCLIESGDPVATASLICDQARSIEHRPTLPDGWPTVADMTTAISDFYESVRR
jgi:glycosyltransferase involved in cell wall biosynthesis